MAERLSRRERSRQLLDLALELITENGYEALTMAAVARAAGVSKPIVYRSFPNRAALLLTLLRREQHRVDGQLDEIIPADPAARHPRELLATLVSDLLTAVEAHPLTWRLVLLPPETTPGFVHQLVERRREELVDRARRLVDWGLAYLDDADTIDHEVLARILVSLIQAQARLLLADPDSDRNTLLSSTTALIEAIAWRETPRTAVASTTNPR